MDASDQKPLPHPDYASKDSDAFKRISGFNKAMTDSIEKIGFEKTGIAMLIAFYEACGEE